MFVYAACILASFPARPLYTLQWPGNEAACVYVCMYAKKV